MKSVTTYETEYGRGFLLWRDGVLTGHTLPSQNSPGTDLSADRRIETVEPVAARLVTRLEAYFKGERTEFAEITLPLDWSLWSAFHRKVLQALAAVPYGETVSYGDLAVAAGHPRAHRAVGSVMAANPLPLLLPCHRVIRSDGRPGGFSAGMGWKERLLRIEGVCL